LEGVWLAETNLDLLVGILEEDVTHGIKFVLCLLFIKDVKIHLDVLLSVQCNSGVSASNGGWENLQHRLN
jgi:hypothetical protein